MGRRPSLIYESPMQPCATWVLRWLTFCTAHHSRCSTQKWTKNWAKPAIFGCASEPGQHISAVCSWVWGLGVTVLSEPNCIQVQQKAGSSVVRHRFYDFLCNSMRAGQGCWDATEGRFEQGRDGGTCVQQIASRSRALQQRPHHCNASLRLVESKSLAR